MVVVVVSQVCCALCAMVCVLCVVCVMLVKGVVHIPRNRHGARWTPRHRPGETVSTPN